MTVYTLKTDPVTTETASEHGRQLLESAEQALGFSPNMYKAIAISPITLDTYMHGYQLLRERSDFSPTEQEIIFLTISRYHGCSYCMSAHSMLAEKASGVPANVLKAIRDGEPLPDKRLAALNRFVHVMVDTRGLPLEQDVQEFLDAGFTEPQILQVVLAIAVKTLSNFSNHLTQPEVDPPFADYAWKG